MTGMNQRKTSPMPSSVFFSALAQIFTTNKPAFCAERDFITEMCAVCCAEAYEMIKIIVFNNFTSYHSNIKITLIQFWSLVTKFRNPIKIAVINLTI